MNQIISYVKLKNKKMRIFFYIQLIVSIIVVLTLLIYLLKNKEKDTSKNILDIKTNFKLSKIYNNNISNKYIGKLIIKNINLEYPIFKEYTEENLKISLCKFSGDSLYENGNVTILGHNYINRFFYNLKELEINDEIIIDLNREYI